MGICKRAWGWEVTVDVVKGSGCRRERRTKTCKTREDAERLLADWKAELGQDNRRRPPFASWERRLTERWAKEIGGQTQVPLRCGVADIVTRGHVFEVKEVSGWKAAIGQVLVYAGELGLKPCVLLFSPSYPPEEKMQMIDEACERLGVLCIFKEATFDLIEVN